MTATPRSTRREFLQGKATTDALVAAVSSEAARGELAAPVADSYLLRLSRRAMACNFELFFNAGQYSQATEAGLAALDLVDRLEDQLSIYREHSEITWLNRRAAEGPVAVEPGLFTLLQQAERISRDTHGAYDITSGPLSNAWGFSRRSGVIPTAEVLDDARGRVGSRFLEFDDAMGSVGFLRPGLEINLGSIGKGYALDRCAELLVSAGIHDFLLHGGNSSVRARGAHGALQDGWSVGVRNPLHPQRRLGQMLLKDRALATSGSGTQFFLHAGRRYGHILDPRTGWPAEGVLTASVLAPTAAEADALSTAFYVIGPDGAREYCARHRQIAAVLVCPGAREGGIDRHLIGLDDRLWSEFDQAN